MPTKTYRNGIEDVYVHTDAAGALAGYEFSIGPAVTTAPYKIRGNVFTLYYDIFIPVGMTSGSVPWDLEPGYAGYTFVDLGYNCLPLIKWGSAAQTGVPDPRVAGGIRSYLRFDTMYLVASQDITGLAPPSTNGVGTWQPFVFRNTGNAVNASGGTVWSSAAIGGPTLPIVGESNVPYSPNVRYLSPGAAGTKSNMFSLAIVLAGGAAVSIAGYIRAEVNFTVFG